MAYESFSQSMEQPNEDLETQAHFLTTLRNGQHEVLTSLDIPKKLARYALTLNSEDPVALEILSGQSPNSKFFLWRKSVVCQRPLPDRKKLAVQIYHVGMSEDPPASAVYLPPPAARFTYENSASRLIFPCDLDVTTVQTIVRMTDEVHAMPELPNLSEKYPGILPASEIKKLQTDEWPDTEELDIIPLPWHPVAFAGSIEKAGLQAHLDQQ